MAQNYFMKKCQNVVQLYGFCFDRLRNFKWWDTFIISILVGVSFFLFGPNLDAKWWIVDDHEIIYYSTPKPLGFSDIIPTLFTKTEINPLSTATRYRPIYYFFRLLETRLWLNAGPRAWYLTRIIGFIIFLCVLYYFFKKYCGTFLGFLLTLLVSNMTFWADVISRLGPAEFYSIIGLSIFLVGVLIFQKKNTNIYSWILMSLGIIILVGSKENMGIFLIPYSSIFIYHLIKKPSRKMVPILSFIITAIWSIWVYSNLLHRILLNKGFDFYENSFSIGDRFSYFSNMSIEKWTIYISVVLFMLLGIIGHRIYLHKPNNNVFRISLIGSILLLLILVSQDFFYSGSIWGRYNFPIALVLPLLICLAIYMCRLISINSGHNVFPFISVVLGVIFIISLHNNSNWEMIHEISNQNVNRTQYFMTKVEDLTNYLNVNPNISVIIYGNDASSDFELSLSYSRFIRGAKANNPIYILRNPPENYKEELPRLTVSLENRLMEYSKLGNPEWNISPLQMYKTAQNKCLLITLKMDHNSPIKCNDVINGNVLLEYNGLYDHK